MATVSPPAAVVNQQYAPVKCPHCGRYLGAFVGKAQCSACKAWVVTVDKLNAAD